VPPTSIDTNELIRAILAVVLGACGTWLLLPHRHGRLKPRAAHAAGAVLAAIALILLAGFWSPPTAGGLTNVFFYAFTLTALGSAVMTITSRDPVYSALWFAAVVLATSGLFLLAGAQFLAAGTIIVYAGAIIVTFLFVLMLAQREGRATYDRMARSPGRATLTCVLLFWSLFYTLMMVQRTGVPARQSDVQGDYRLPRGSRQVAFRRLQPQVPTTNVLNRSQSATNRLPESESDNASGRHVAGLGGTLYTDHLVTVELAGALLFVALIGALAIASPRPPVRPDRVTPPTD
jgi:NADH-quinone oxidoreductase subunit J